MKLTRLCAFTLALTTLFGCDPEEEGITGVTAPTGFAVSHTDYDSAGAIALLAPDGALEQARFIHSGTTFPGLGTALSSDVVLPTQPGSDGVLTYIERLGSDRVTRIEIATGTVLGQVQTHADNSTGYRSNPYDYLHIDDDQAWVTRNAPNTAVAATDDSAGNDMLLLNLTDHSRGDARISFASMNGTASVTNPDTNETMDVTVYARPAGLVKVGRHAVVGLDRISLAYDAIGAGMIAVADLNARTATSLALPGLANCGTVVPVIDDASRVIVACQGSFLDNPQDTAGLAVIRVVDGAATIDHLWATSEHTSDPMAVSSVVSLGGTRVVAVAPGNFSDRPDSAYVLDIATGDMDLLADGGGSYVFGGGAYNPVDRVLLIPDASTDSDGIPNVGVRRFQWDDADEATELSVVVTDPNIAPRTVAPLR